MRCVTGHETQHGCLLNGHISALIGPGKFPTDEFNQTDFETISICGKFVQIKVNVKGSFESRELVTRSFRWLEL